MSRDFLIKIQSSQVHREAGKQKTTFMHTLNIPVSVCVIILVSFDIYFLTLVLLYKNSNLKQICNFSLECQFQSLFSVHLQDVMQRQIGITLP